MSDITITIHGGNNQILPNATEAIQNFYVGEYCGETSLEEGDGRSGLMPETIRFRAYINKEEDLERYLAQIVECRTVTELAQVILVMQENELKITPEEMVKERFIRLFLPITPRITKGQQHPCPYQRCVEQSSQTPLNWPFLRRYTAYARGYILR